MLEGSHKTLLRVRANTPYRCVRTFVTQLLPVRCLWMRREGG